MGYKTFLEDERYYGVFVGEVVNTLDPQNYGRIQVRIFEIYGEEGETPDENIPWAYEVSKFGGSYDSGSKSPYLKGSTVLIAFEYGNPMHPFVIGGVPKKTESSWEYQGPYSNTSNIHNPPDSDTDIPKEGKSNNTRYIAWKTPKGATIIVEEDDEGEYLRIIDRAGQVIEMSSPVVKKSGGNPRGERNKIDSDGLDYSEILPPSTIRVVDLAGQEILLSSESGKELVSITSQNRDGSKKQSLVFDTTSGQENILLKDSSGQFFKLSASDNKVLLTSLGDKTENITGNSTELVGIDKTITSTGKMTLAASGAMLLSALSTFTLAVTGALVLNALAAATLTVAGVFSMLSTAIVLGVSGSEKRIVNEDFITLFNTHTHTYSPGPNPPAATTPPLVPGVIGTHSTVNTKAS